MAVNRGKDFEHEIFQALDKVPNVSIDRYPDPMAGFAGIRNICDFGVFRAPNFVYIECKSKHGNTLNFKNDITESQWNGLLEKSVITGVFAGIIVWFIDHDVTAFVPIQEFQRLKDEGAYSLNIKDLKEGNVQNVPVSGKKRRILFSYEGQKFLDDLQNYF